jgi:hypothetical protein
MINLEESCEYCANQKARRGSYLLNKEKAGGMTDAKANGSAYLKMINLTSKDLLTCGDKC